MRKRIVAMEEYGEKVTKWSHKVYKKINELKSPPNLPMLASVLDTQSIQNIQENVNAKLLKLSIPIYFRDTSYGSHFVPALKIRFTIMYL